MIEYLQKQFSTELDLSVNEMVASASAIMMWKSKQFMDPLGQRLFPVQIINEDGVILRSSKSDKVKLPVPGNPNLAVNLMALAWNENPELRKARTLGSAKLAAQKWAKINHG